MNGGTFLRGQSVAVSISESPDLAQLGLSDRHLRDVWAEVARQLLTAGARLLYGGDLRAQGFTRRYPSRSWNSAAGTWVRPGTSYSSRGTAL
jgi:hypothetical protein